MKQRFTFSLRAIADQIDRAKLRTTLTYSLTRRFQVGVEWNPLAQSVSPLANLHLVEEGRRRPALIAGTSSDRIGTPSGQSFYATVSKAWRGPGPLAVAPYAGAAYGTYEDKLRAIGGLNVSIGAGVSALVIFDGVHVHELLSYSRGRHAFSLILVRGHDPGLSYSVRF